MPVNLWLGCRTNLHGSKQLFRVKSLHGCLFPFHMLEKLGRKIHKWNAKKLNVIFLECLRRNTESVLIFFRRHGHRGFCGEGIIISLKFSEVSTKTLATLPGELILFFVSFSFPFWTSYFLEFFSPSPFAFGCSVATKGVNSSYGTIIVAVLKSVF